MTRLPDHVISQARILRVGRHVLLSPPMVFKRSDRAGDLPSLPFSPTANRSSSRALEPTVPGLNPSSISSLLPGAGQTSHMSPSSAVGHRAEG